MLIMIYLQNQTSIFMKKIYTFITVVLLALNTNAQIVNIPDADFKQILLNYNPRIDTNFDNEIQQSEAAAVSELNIPNINDDATGLNAFINLVKLELNTRNVAVNFSGMIRLEELELGFYSPIGSTDFSPLIALKKISLDSYPGVDINLSTASNLEFFKLHSPHINSNLFLTPGSTLKHVEIANSTITSLDLSQFTRLEYIDLDENRITNLTLPLPNNTLKHLSFSNNSTGAQSVFNASIYTALEYLSIKKFLFDSLNATGLTALTTLICNNYRLNSIDITGSNNITDLDLSDNYLTALNISNLPHLKHLNVTSNHGLGTLDLSNQPNLVSLNCRGNNLAALNISNKPLLEKLDCRSNQISALDLSNHPAMTELIVSGNPLITIDVSQLLNLTVLECNSTQLSSLNVSMLSALEKLDCSANPLHSLNISNLVHLENLQCQYNRLTQLDLTPFTKLQTLNCNDNSLTSLDLTTTPLLQYLSCAQNQLTAIDFSNTTLLNTVDVENNLFTTLDFSPITNEWFSASYDNNPLLTYLNLKAAVDIYMFSLLLDIENCPNVSYICASESDAWAISNHFINENITGIQVNSYCSFAPGGLHNSINGKLTLDLNNNGCGAGDFHYPGIKIEVDNGSESGGTFTNTTGNYLFYTQAGSYTLTPQFENDFFTISPTSATINFDETNGTTQTQDFCITPNGVHKDLEIAIVSSIPARPGFDATYIISYKNKGNQTLSGNVNLAFNDTVLDFVSATPATSSQNVGVLNWDFTNLQPFESRNIIVVVNANGPMETPPVNIDDILNFTASISPFANDETPLDNVFTLEEIVTGSFDPNDKTCLEGNTIAPENIGKYVHYLIRFQNSGTAPAEFVVVKDVIDTTKFEMDSFQLTSVSHPQTTKITGNKIEFYFQNINLPAEQDDEPGSHGFVAFKIKTKSNLVLGDKISNSADIFFDYNFPIVTEPAESTFAVLGLNNLENTSVVVEPNPVTDKLNISANDTITSIQVYDVQGRLIQTVLEHKKAATINLEKQTSGVYFVKIQTEKGSKTEKIIKR